MKEFDQYSSQQSPDESINQNNQQQPATNVLQFCDEIYERYLPIDDAASKKFIAFSLCLKALTFYEYTKLPLNNDLLLFYYEQAINFLHDALQIYINIDCLNDQYAHAANCLTMIEAEYAKKLLPPSPTVDMSTNAIHRFGQFPRPDDQPTGQAVTTLQPNGPK